MPSYFSRYRTPRGVQRRRKNYASTRLAYQLYKIVRNPFYICQDARIPDGRAHMSLPVKVQAVEPHTLNTEFNEFLFYPGLNSALRVFDSGSGSVQFPIGQHARCNEDGVQSNPAGQVVQWRTVSAGLRLSLINNAVTNEGWFEAARISLPKESTLWNFASISAAPSATQRWVQPSDKNAFIPSDRATLKNSPTYVTGKLRDIDMVMFTLKPTGDVHEFNTLRDGAQGNEAYRYVDEGFDAIWIRVHGVANTTKLLVNYVLNQEIVYDEAAELARAMTSFAQYPNVAKNMQYVAKAMSSTALTIPTAMDTSPDGNPAPKRPLKYKGMYAKKKQAYGS